MSIKLRIPGQREAASSAAARSGSPAADGATTTDLLDDVQVVEAYALSRADRAGGGGPPNEVTVEEDDILEIEVDGFKLWTSAAKYGETVRAFRPGAVQAGGIMVDAPPNADATRGDDESASAVRILRLAKGGLQAQLNDPAIAKEFLDDFGLTLIDKAGSWLLAKAIIWLVERRLRPSEGLYSWTDATRLPEAGPAPIPATFDSFDTSQPILLFLHGTASSTRGSFAGFLDRESAGQWKELTDLFKGHIYAFEHKTLSRSPIENAIAVARRLPEGASLHLVSHSRGGLIGDLLCLPSIDEDQIGAFIRSGGSDEADEYDRKGLRQLSGILQDKRFRVQRFARAACPARGTLLASENLDQFLSVLTYLVGLIPFLKLSPTYEVIKRIALETAQRRWEPNVLPGLEAMIPESPLIRLLNETADEASGDLGVIAGDIQSSNWLKRFGVFISDRMLYDNRDNDLVVNTDSMFLGASRKVGRYVFDQGSDVSHFNYFKNRRTRTRVTQWVTAKNTAALTEFRELAEARVEPVPMQRGADIRASTNRPTVVLVPDFMGSDLYAGSSRVWLNRDALSKGGFKDLADLTEQGAVQAKSVLGEHYARLRDYLSDTHDVMPFAYDWRRSTTDGAAALGAFVGGLLGSTTQPVRILAHGAGGLLVAQWIADTTAGPAADAWRKASERAGSRVVLLGTPFNGTFESVELLMGTHPVAQQLALLDPKLGLKGVIEIFQAFPGVLEMLPRDGAVRFFEAATWSGLGPRRDLPIDAALLHKARAVSEILRGRWSSTTRVCNVVGTAPRTVSGVDQSTQQLALEVTTEGDGRVTHESAKLPGHPTWHADADHGALAADLRVFPAIVELLTQGETRLLATSAPSAGRGGEQRRRTVPERVLYPTATDLMAGVFGRRSERPSGAADGRAGFRVSVVHGDLTFARYPIVVGHYEGDTIIGPESVVDRMFDGALTTRYNLGLYPGRLGTSSIVIRQPTRLQRALQMPTGAIVVGLGRWGELTAGQIANIVRRGALEYVLQIDDHASPDSGGGLPAEVGEIGLSVLLIGATAANISTQDSVAAILRGIAQANLELDSIEDVHTRIGTLEIVELYVDTAIEAARAARQLSTALSDELKIRIEPEPWLQRGRYGRVRYAAARNLDAWRRWEVTAEQSTCVPQLPEQVRQWLSEFTRRDGVDPALLGALAGLALFDQRDTPHDRFRFVSLSDRARAEVMMEQHQPKLIERLVQSSIGSTRYNADAARALFELMVPNDLKDGLGQLSNVVFVLDGQTAALPWELMSDGGDQPLGTRLRIVRQLQSAEFRPHIRTTTTMSAYVVGDPRVTPPFKQLNGARKEADAVEERLTAGKFEVTRLQPEATALDVLGGLFARPYRIVHLAGHGHFRAAAAGFVEISGMVLDSGAYLTAAEVRKMAQVPELVFLNCCFIGQTGPGASESKTGVPYNRLAASISRELIEMGVRAVVAAGWAVRDDAALFFAQAFYDSMLGGETFGRALSVARKATWRQFQDCNTWGAYQAYGDPDFRLTKESTAGASTERVAPEELLEQIDRIWRQARRIDQKNKVADTARDADRAEAERIEQIEKLRDLAAKVPEAWLKRSEILVAIGEAYGELAEFSDAIRMLELALDTGEIDSKTTIKAAEQLLNFSTRVAEKERNQTALEAAIDRLEALQKVGETSERHSLLGSAYKRLAGVLATTPGNPDAISALMKAAEHYKKAHDRNKQFDHYPVVNWLALKVVLNDPPPELADLLRQAQQNAEQRFVRDRSTRDAVFSAVASADIAVVQALANQTFATAGTARTDEINRIVQLYREAFQRAEATSRQQQSAIGQLETLERLLTGLSPTPDKLTIEALTQIRNGL